MIAGIPTKEYVESIERGVVPEKPPVCATYATNSQVSLGDAIEGLLSRGYYDLSGLDSLLTSTKTHPDYVRPMTDYEAKNRVRMKGIYPILTMEWVRQVAEWIGDRKTLEVMAGTGWLARALAECGANVTATDSYSWHFMKTVQRVYPIQKMKAETAIKKLGGDAELLIICWPDFRTRDVCVAAEEWGPDRPILYIGEGNGGACACSEFFSRFEEEEEPQVLIPSWPCLHDRLSVGRYREAPEGIEFDEFGCEVYNGVSI